MVNELQPLLIWRKKTFTYDFFPSKAEEEEVNNTPWVVTRELIQPGPGMTIDLSKLRWIKKKITPEDLAQGRLGISSFDTFEYILPYLKLDMANSLVNGSVMDVGVWDITGTNGCKKYEGETVSFRKLPNDDYSLTIEELINDRGLGVGDEIALGWNPRSSIFMFILLAKVRDSRITPVELINL